MWLGMEDIGKRLRKIRESKNLKLTGVAKTAGISQSSLSFIETGKNQPTVETVHKILTALNMTLAEFFAIESQDLTTLPHDIWILVRNSDNYNLLRLIIALKAEGISNDLIAEMIKAISNTLRIAKKEGVYWATEEITEEKKKKGKRFAEKIKKSGLKPDKDNE